MKEYKRLEISTGDLDQLVEECCRILTLWQKKTPDKVVCYSKGPDGESGYRVVDVPDGPVVID